MDRIERTEANQNAESADLTAMDPALRRAQKVAGRFMPAASYAAVLTLALPTIVEQVLQAVIGLTDTIIAGHIPGNADTVAAAGAAVGVMTYLQWFAGLMTSAFSVGATAIVARSIGARRPRVANRVAGTALSGAFLVGVIVALGLFVFAPQVVWACGLRQQAAVFGQQYLRIMAVTISLQTAAQIGMASLRGAGDTLRPMLITATVMAVNVITSSSFCFGWLGAPAWGIRGNAFGTMLAFMVGGVATVVVLCSGWTRLHLRPRHLRVVPHVLARILRIGLPSWVENMLLWTGQFLIVILVINPNDLAIGTSGATMAAHNAVLRIESIAFLPGFGFGIAASALVGQYLGAKLSEEARRAAKLANRLAFATMTLAAIPMVAIPGVMLGHLVSSPPVVRTGWWPMVLAGLAQPGFAIAIVMGSALKGAGETVWPMVVTITGMFLVRVPILLLMLLVFRHLHHPEWGLIAVWIGIVADLNYRAVFNGVVFWLGHWQRKRV